MIHLKYAASYLGHNYKIWSQPQYAYYIVNQSGVGIAVLLGQSKAVKHEIETKQKPFLNLLQNIPVQMQVSLKTTIVCGFLYYSFCNRKKFTVCRDCAQRSLLFNELLYLTVVHFLTLIPNETIESLENVWMLKFGLFI